MDKRSNHDLKSLKERYIIFFTIFITIINNDRYYNSVENKCLMVKVEMVLNFRIYKKKNLNQGEITTI